MRFLRALCGVLISALTMALVVPALASAQPVPGLTLTGAQVIFGDGTGGYATGAAYGGEFTLWVYDQSGNLLNTATTAPAPINIPLNPGSTTFKFLGSYYPYNPVINNLANELSLSVDGSNSLVIDDHGTPQNPQIISTVVNGFTVSVSDFTLNENTSVDQVDPFDANPGPYGNSTGSFTITVTHVPTSTAQCKNGGWQMLSDNSGTPFKNQGDCVSYVATGGRNGANG